MVFWAMVWGEECGCWCGFGERNAGVWELGEWAVLGRRFWDFWKEEEEALGCWLLSTHALEKVVEGDGFWGLGVGVVWKRVRA